MVLSLFLKTFIIGLLITGGLGPIGILCLRRSLSSGLYSGIVTGLGASAADSLFTFITLVSINLIHDPLTKHAEALKFLSAIFFIIFGIKMLFTVKKLHIPHRVNLINDFATAGLLTLANPTALLPIIALFLTFSINQIEVNFVNTTFIICSIFIGSMTWWLFLSMCGHFLKRKVNEKLFITINNITGLGLIFIGSYTIAYLFFNRLL